MKFLNKKNAIFFVIIFFLFFSILYWTPLDWDSAVYIGMGKYIFSFGDSGLWEASRPLLWPIILGLIWKIGLNPVIFGKAISLLFAIGCIFMTYLLGKEVFDENTGLLAAIFIAFTPAFFLAGSQIMTEIPSAFFALTGVYLFIRKRYAYSGILFGLTFMTRFFQIMIFFVFFLFLIYNGYTEKSIKKSSLMLFGFLIPLIPYLALNLIAYQNSLYPFILQYYMTQNTGWPWWEPVSFYFINLIKQNFFVLFYIFGLIFTVKQKKKNAQRILIALAFLLPFILYAFARHKEMRFLIGIFPYLYLMVSYGILCIIGKARTKKAALLVLAILMGIWLVFSFNQFKVGTFDKTYSIYYTYLASERVSAKIWITNPLYLLESDKKAELIYYPAFGTDLAREMQIRILTASHVFFSPCDLSCPPWDETCPKEKNNLFEVINNNFREVYRTRAKECDYYIFTSLS